MKETPLDKENNPQQTEQKKKQTESIPLRTPEPGKNNFPSQNSGAPGTTHESGSKGSANNPVPATHGTNSAYSEGSTKMHTKLQESLQQTGNLNHPDTKKKEMAYKETLDIDQIRKYDEIKSAEGNAKSTTGQTPQNNTQQQTPQFIPQATTNSGKFRLPAVYKNQGKYTVDFHENQTDYDGSLITSKEQFNAFMTRVLNESDVVLPEDKPNYATLTGVFDESMVKLLKEGKTINYTPKSNKSELEKETKSEKSGTGQGAGTGHENGAGTAQPKKTAAELQEEYDAFPEAVKNLIRTSEEGGWVTAEEKLAVAQYIFDNLTVLEMLDYASKTSKSTMSLFDFKASIQNYKESKAKRESNQKERAELEKKLGTASFKELYTLYKDYANWAGLARMNIRDRVSYQIMMDKAEELRKALENAGYKGGIKGFEDLIREYETAFEQEALYTAIDQLQKYKHILFEEKNKLENPAYLQQLLNQLKGTGAKEMYSAGNSQIAGASKVHKYADGFEIQVDYDERDKGQQKVNKADSLVGTISNDLVKEKQFDKPAFAQVSNAAELKAFMKNYIQEKEASIDNIQEKIINNPEAIYGMDLLYNSCKQAQGIAPGSTLDAILTDKKGRIENFEFIKNLAIAFGAIVLTIASAGTGTLALVALGASFALSAYTVYETIETYKTEKDGYNAGVLSDDPSLVWVVIAIAGAVVDAAALRSAFKAAEPIAEAASEFNRLKDITKLEKRLEAITELKKEVRANIVKQAKVEAQYERVMQGITQAKKLTNATIPFLLQTGELLTHLVFAVRKGILTFEGILLELKAARLIEDLGTLSKADITTLEKTFAKAKTLAKDDKLAIELEQALAEQDFTKLKTLLDEVEKIGKWQTKFDEKFIEYLGQYSNDITNPKGRDKVWRVIRDDQSAYTEIVAKSETGLTKSGSPFTIEGHVATGTRTETPFISSFSDEKLAIERGLKDGKKVVEIDLTKVQGQFFDLSDETVRNLLIKNPRTRRFAQASSEFLIVTDKIPVNAIKAIK
ncbi:hypothetical protein [Flavobacterium sp. WV_118_3]|uniref:hypothetical protein n=1 Tax=Flavobacterium sp. WV_118_3 TaxID=3151764 RepID=UPI003219E9A8